MTVPFVIAGIVLGLLGGAGGLYNSMKTLNQMLKQDETPPTQGYNQHD